MTTNHVTDPFEPIDTGPYYIVFLFILPARKRKLESFSCHCDHDHVVGT